MEFKIPFTFSDLEILKRKSKYFRRFSSNKETSLSTYLQNSGIKIQKQDYLAICYRNFLLNLLIISIVVTSILVLTGKIRELYLWGNISAVIITLFIFINQYNYPKIFCLNKTRNIEKNLISALQDILVQLNSGVPLFSIMINIANSNYGEVSEEFKKIVAEINSGISQIQALEKYGKLNTSQYFKRVLWQISNGMRAGSDISIVIKEEIRNLAQEQSIQIQSYGSKLNPLVMFYMIITVILPALGITFIIIISSMVSLSSNLIKMLLVIILFVIVFIQIMFLGLIKSRRPSLL